MLYYIVNVDDSTVFPEGFNSEEDAELVMTAHGIDWLSNSNPFAVWEDSPSLRADFKCFSGSLTDFFDYSCPLDTI